MGEGLQDVVPSDVCWFKKHPPKTIIKLPNYSFHGVYKPIKQLLLQLTAILGAPSCVEVSEDGGTPNHHPSHA